LLSGEGYLITKVSEPSHLKRVAMFLTDSSWA
jgi:hypothetical protein